MPRLVADAGDVALVGGVAQDEAVLGAVVDEPALGVGGLLGLVQLLVGGIHEIDGEGGLVLARAGAGDPEGSGLLGIGPGQALLLLGPLRPGSEQPLLVVVAAVGRAHLGAHAGRSRAIEEGHEVVEDAPVDGEPVGAGDIAALGRLEALGQGVRAVDEAQVPG